MKTYKVWIEVEEYNDENDTYIDIGDHGPSGTFNTAEEALNFADILYTIAQNTP